MPTDDVVARLEAEAARAGITVNDADRAKVRGDVGVHRARAFAAGFRNPLLLAAGFRHRDLAAEGVGIWDHPKRRLRLICAIAREDDGKVWCHLSLSHASHRMPTFEELRWAKEVVFPDRVALQVFPPQSEWYTLDEPDAAEVLHLFVCLDERPTPDFRGSAGTL